MTVIAVIQARMNSTRFPGKVLSSLAGKPMLKHVIDRVERAESVDSLIVATAGSGAENIERHCEAWGVDCYVGDELLETDVVSRFVCALARYRGDDYCVRVCGDNPLIAPAAIDALILVAQLRRPDYVGYRMPDKTPAIQQPLGWFAEVAKVDALHQLAYDLPLDHAWREHVTQGLYEQWYKFQCCWLQIPQWYWHDHCARHVAVDTKADLKRVERILDEWARQGFEGPGMPQ